jgi:hypothetical protein
VRFAGQATGHRAERMADGSRRCGAGFDGVRGGGASVYAAHVQKSARALSGKKRFGPPRILDPEGQRS